MSIVSFTVSDTLKRVVDHAIASKKWSGGYSEETPTEPSLLLVGDRGVYLMSAGIPGDLLSSEPGKTSLNVAYADDLSPNDQGWYDTKGYIFGGDDFGDLIGGDWTKEIKSQIDKGAKKIRFNITFTNMRLLAPK